MKRFTGFEHGMSIGGWLTYYKRLNVLPVHQRSHLTIGDMEHFATYITEDDIPYCVWNYLSTLNDGNRFSLVDDDNRKILSDEMARIICGDSVI